jgi:hypothetical protein
MRVVEEPEMSAGPHEDGPAEALPANWPGSASSRACLGGCSSVWRGRLRSGGWSGARWSCGNTTRRGLCTSCSPGAVQVLVYFEGVGDLLMGVQRLPGSLIAGWSAFRPPYRHTSSLECEEATELIRLPRETFEEIFEEDPYLGYQILKRVATAVDHRLEGSVTFLLETPTIPDQA